MNINSNKCVLELKKLIDEAIKDSNSIKLNNSDSLYQFKWILKCFLFKATYICNATLAMLQKDIGLYRETHVMARVLLEYFVSIEYINRIDRIGLSERFYRYNEVCGYVFKEDQIKLYPTQKRRFDNHPGHDNLKRGYEEYMRDYGDNKQNRRYWSGKPLEQMADCIGERWLYNRVYRFQCLYVHPGPKSIICDLQMKNNDIVIERKINTGEIDQILNTCVNLFSRIYHICIDVFGFGEKKKAWSVAINIDLSALNDENEIRQIIKEKKCPYCSEFTIKDFNESEVIQLKTDDEIKEVTYYLFGCRNEFCVERFHIPKILYDKLQTNLQARDKC